MIKSELVRLATKKITLEIACLVVFLELISLLKIPMVMLNTMGPHWLRNPSDVLAWQSNRTFQD